MRAETLRDFARRIVFEDEAPGLALLPAALRFVFSFVFFRSFGI